MDGYLKAEEIAKQWGISARKVQEYCKDGRISGAVKFGPAWAIPKDAQKPTRTGKLKPGRKPKPSEGQLHERTDI
jgi:DNA-binding transcriptional regulator LsrR (DeoR family)